MKTGESLWENRGGRHLNYLYFTSPPSELLPQDGATGTSILQDLRPIIAFGQFKPGHRGRKDKGTT